MPKGSAVINHLSLCNHSPSFESFSVLAMENRKFVLELKERKYPNNERYTFFKQKDHICFIIPIRQSIANVNFCFGEFNSWIPQIRFWIVMSFIF